MKKVMKKEEAIITIACSTHFSFSCASFLSLLWELWRCYAASQCLRWCGKFSESGSSIFSWSPSGAWLLWFISFKMTRGLVCLFASNSWTVLFSWSCIAHRFAQWFAVCQPRFTKYTNAVKKTKMHFRLRLPKSNSYRDGHIWHIRIVHWHSVLFAWKTFRMQEAW